MVDIQAEEQFLHEERSAIESYLQNVSLPKKEMLEYRRLAKALAELTKIKTKLSSLVEEKDAIISIQELFSVVELDTKALRKEWVKKNKDHLKESKRYETKKMAYLNM